jgi:peptide methionine sulfoxide reductase msrA/msrB
MMALLKWIDVVRFARHGNPAPDRTVRKSDEEWRARLGPEEYRVTRLKGTERPHSSPMCDLLEPGLYACICCGAELFDSGEKFRSGTGWPSFTQPIRENAVAYRIDESHGMQRVETTCNVCEAHLGHVFPDGPAPSGLRYCINAAALRKVEKRTRSAVFGGGCFWCTEAVFQQVQGVERVESGYSGGETVNPTYREVCGGRTGHAEVVRVEYDPEAIGYADLLRIHLGTHDPTTLNRQGSDAGTQYRSIILPADEEEEATARRVIEEMQPAFDHSIVTEVKRLEAFYPAEDYHQNYYRDNPEQGYCRVVISPKLEKFRKLYKERLKEASQGVPKPG